MSRASLVVIALTVVPCWCANPHPDLGGYQPVTNVIEHSQVVYDITDMTTALNLYDWVKAKAIYTNGKFSCKSTSARTLQGFVSAATVTSKLAGELFYDSFMEIQIAGSKLSPTFWDDFILAGLDGTGGFAGKSDLMRKVAVQKAILGVLTLYTTHEMESGIGKAANATMRVDSKAPHAWDEAWAFFYGSYQLEAGAAFSGKNSAWEFTSKRDSDFACGSENGCIDGAVEGKSVVLAYFLQGLKAIRSSTYNEASLKEARDNIYRILALSSIRAALKYAYKTNGGGAYKEDYHIEAYTYFLAGAGWIEKHAPGVASAVLELLDFKKSGADLDPNLYCAVKAKLIPAYKPLGLSCEFVGKWKDLPSGVSCPDLPACPSGVAALPAGEPKYSSGETDTTAGTNVDCSDGVYPFAAASAVKPVAEESSVAASGAVCWRMPGLAAAAAALSSLLW
jgi:hypothetical protein